MGSKRKVIDKEFKMNAVQYRKKHPELTYTEIADNLGAVSYTHLRDCEN